jgi:hypothetical protein
LAGNLVSGQPEVIGLSHVDLDALGGVMALMGIKPEAPDFWEAAAYVDLNGPHKLWQIDPAQEVMDQLNAYWAFSQDHRVFPNRDGLATDVTAKVEEHVDALLRILQNDSKLIDAGRRWAEAQESLEADSFRQESLGVILRSAPAFVNHLYNHGDCHGVAVVAYNEKYKSCTVSFADPIPGISCRELVQGLWGELAGGHDTIAGSPRGQEMTFADAQKLFERVCTAISAI